MRETAYEPVMVTLGGPDDYPRFLAQKAGLEQPDLPIAPGDRILAVGDVDLRGAGAAGWIAAFARHQGAALRIPVLFEAAGQQHRTTLVAGSYRAFWPRHLASLAFVVCALFLAFRARPTRLVDAIVWTNLVVGDLLRLHVRRRRGRERARPRGARRVARAGGTARAARGAAVPARPAAAQPARALRSVDVRQPGPVRREPLLRHAVLARGRRARQRRGRPRSTSRSPSP